MGGQKGRGYEYVMRCCDAQKGEKKIKTSCKPRPLATIDVWLWRRHVNLDLEIHIMITKVSRESWRKRLTFTDMQLAKQKSIIYDIA